MYLRRSVRLAAAVSVFPLVVVVVVALVVSRPCSPLLGGVVEKNCGAVVVVVCRFRFEKMNEIMSYHVDRQIAF